MRNTLTEAKLVEEILDHLRSGVLPGDVAGELTDRTPLLELGLLNSIRTAALLAFVRDRFGLPAERLAVSGETLKDVRTLAGALLQLRV